MSSLSVDDLRILRFKVRFYKQLKEEKDADTPWGENYAGAQADHYQSMITLLKQKNKRERTVNHEP